MKQHAAAFAILLCAAGCGSLGATGGGGSAANGAGDVVADRVGDVAADGVGESAGHGVVSVAPGVEETAVVLAAAAHVAAGLRRTYEDGTPRRIVLDPAIPGRGVTGGAPEGRAWDAEVLRRLHEPLFEPVEPAERVVLLEPK